MSQKQITQYYNDLAKQYDENRFGNSYGTFINQQEKDIVRDLLKSTPLHNVLDIGCGTGRFLEFADFGLDASEEMINVARQKYPSKQFVIATGDNTPFDDNQFEAILSFHLLMHLDKSTTKSMLNETHRILQKGGRFIFDVPSQKRRQATKYETTNWHAANSFTTNEVKSLCGDKWNFVSSHGILFLPIHRFPKAIRPFFQYIDTRFCHSSFKEYSSYLLFVLQKK